MAPKRTPTQPQITPEDVIRLHESADALSADLKALTARQTHLTAEIEAMEREFRQAAKHNEEPPQTEKDKLAEMKEEISQLPARAASLQVERLQAGWAALQAELSLAAQGGAGLIHHPGYQNNISAACLVSPHLAFSDISGPLLARAEEHAAFLEKTVTGLETNIADAEKAVSACAKQMQSISELDATLVKLRNQRRQAVACGEDAASFDAAITEASAACENNEQAKARLTDETEGLNLRLTALNKALDAAKTSQDSPGSVIKLARQCLLAAEYNKHAEKAADLFRQLFETGDSVLSMAENMQTKGWQHGIPGIRHTQLPSSPFGFACNIPRLRLHWRKDDNAQEQEAYFYRTSDKLVSSQIDFARKHHV